MSENYRIYRSVESPNEYVLRPPDNLSREELQQLKDDWIEVQQLLASENTRELTEGIRNEHG